MPEGLFLAGLGALGILTVVFLYPLLLLGLPQRKPSAPPPDPAIWPSVTVITAARNAAGLLPAKLENFRTLDYPADKLTLLVASDASTDETRAIVDGAGDPGIRLVEQTERRGKAAAMNLAVEHVGSDLLLFSDADALLSPGAVRALARYFSDPDVGGVCGLRVAAQSAAGLRDAQQTYIHLDSRLREIESARGRITSNDGKIHMIRRELYTPIPRDVSDDLYTLLSVVAQGFRYVFDPSATAEVAVPARDARHEIERRCRIVILSLTGLFRVRQVLNPLRFGWFAVGLWVNKIGRRLLPFFCLALATGLFVLLGTERGLPVAAGMLLLATIYGLAAALTRSAKLNKPIRLLLYIMAGFIGTAWAVIGFICGRRISSWEPKKTVEASRHE
jgi:glycosyltransferase involved in cell wall biosynthesis